MKTYSALDTYVRGWPGRLGRLADRGKIAQQDLGRAMHWRYGGGRPFFERYFDELSNAHAWCFIVGCNNSGTSLLQRALENTGQISTLPLEGQMYTRVFKRARKRGHERVWGEYLDELIVPREAPLDQAPRLLFDWMSDLPHPISPVIVEKTPANVARMGWLDRAFPTAHFIGLVRNGYAVVEGIRRKGKQPIDHAARHWNTVNELLLRESAGVRRYLEVRYEDLVDQPEATARRIADFLGLESEAMSAAMQARYQINNMAEGEASEVRNFNQGSLDRLTAQERAEITRYASPMLDHFGYTAGIVA
jgi:hypothetical protein